ncbi:alpha/beta hydrolase [Spirillospora sp. CA-253888]
MTRKGRTAGVLFGAATLTAAILGSGPAQAAPTAAAAAQKITWRACPDDRTVQCGKITVPIDWAHPRRGTIKIAVARARATQPKQRLGTLFVNPGGPGGSGVDFALDRGELSKQIRQRYDIVGFDPRGVGASTPVRCAKVGPRPSVHPRNQAELNKLTAYQVKLRQSCRKKTGPLYDFLDAGSVARDMDAIRAALGARKVSYYGVSYGTWLGQRYAELFPGRVQRLALDSTMDHSAAGAARFLVDETRGLETAYKQFAKWCPTSGYCALRGKDPIKVLDALMLRAERGTLHEIGSPRTPLRVPGLAQLVRVSLYDPISWAQLSEELRELGRQKAKKLTAAAVDPTPDGLFAGIMCSDWSFPIRDGKAMAAVKREARKAAPHIRISPLGWEPITACLGRKAGDPQRPYRIKGVPPVLIVNGLGDPATVHPWAMGVNRQIPGSRLLTYNGGGHRAYSLSPCSRKAVDAYLLTGRLPAQGARCPAVLPDYSEMRIRQAPPANPRF